MSLARLIAVLASVAALTVARPASAVTITYDFWLNAPNGYPVDHLVLFAANATDYDVYLSPDVLQPAGVFQLTHTLAFEPTDALILGITERDKDDWWDIVVFTSDDYAAAALGKRYSEMFLSSTPGYLGHNQITPLMQAAHDGDAAALLAVTGFLRSSDAAAAYFDPRGAGPPGPRRRAAAARPGRLGGARAAAGGRGGEPLDPPSRLWSPSFLGELVLRSVPAGA